MSSHDNPDYQLQSLRTQGYAHYRVPTSDAPMRDDQVTVGGVCCRVVAVVECVDDALVVVGLMGANV